MNICFVMDPWESIRPEKDSTLRLVMEAVRREHNVGILQPRNLTVRDNVTYGFVSMIKKADRNQERAVTFHSKVEMQKQRLPMKGFDVIILRKDPPVDWLMLNFLDSVKDDTLIINSIDGLRMANNKLYLTTFEDSHEIIPETHVSKDKDYLLEVIQQSNREHFILKPLDGFGGSGVILLEKRAMSNVISLLDFYIGNSEKKKYVILQEFVQNPDGGDVRVLMLNGEPIGAMRRIPPEGDIRSNVHVGGRVIKHTLTKRDKEICSVVGPRLVRDGLLFAGIDLIGEKLIEVNVLSPGGIVNINRLNKIRLEKQFVDMVEQVFLRKESAFLRKIAYKKEVSGVSK